MAVAVYFGTAPAAVAGQTSSTTAEEPPPIEFTDEFILTCLTNPREIPLKPGQALWLNDCAKAFLASPRLSTCWERDHVALAGRHGWRPGDGASRRVMSPIMAHLTMASACSGSRS